MVNKDCFYLILKIINFLIKVNDFSKRISNGLLCWRI